MESIHQVANSQRMKKSSSVFTPECMADRVASGSLYSVADGRIAENVVSRRGNRPGQRALVRPDDRRPILRFASGVRVRRKRGREEERARQRERGQMCVRVVLACCPLTHSLNHAPSHSPVFFLFPLLLSSRLLPCLVSWLLRLCPPVVVLGRQRMGSDGDGGRTEAGAGRCCRREFS